MENYGHAQVNEKQWLVPQNPNRVTITIVPVRKDQLDRVATSKGFVRDEKPESGRLMTHLVAVAWPLFEEVGFDKEKLAEWLRDRLPQRKRFRG